MTTHRRGFFKIFFCVVVLTAGKVVLIVHFFLIELKSFNQTTGGRFTLAPLLIAPNKGIEIKRLSVHEPDKQGAG